VIDQVLNEIFTDFIHEDEKALFETVGPHGERLDSPDGRCVNPGHARERMVHHGGV
jgi:N-acylglucosamine 2-epimerase